MSRFTVWKQFLFFLLQKRNFEWFITEQRRSISGQFQVQYLFKQYCDTLGCDAMLFCRYVPKFWRNVLPPSPECDTGFISFLCTLVRYFIWLRTPFYSRGGQLDGLGEPHAGWQRRRDACINEEIYLFFFFTDFCSCKYCRSVWFSYLLFL